MPKISVLMSVYNGEKHLAESIESILGQTFTDFEFIILNDGSTDSTFEIIYKYAIRDPRIRYAYNGENLGLTKSLNRGLKFVRSEYVARQDADDVSLPRRLERQLDYMSGHPEVAVVGSNVEIIDESGKVLRTTQYPTDHEAMRAELLLGNYAICHSAAMIRFSDLIRLGGYDETLYYAQDYELWWRLSRERKLANLPEVLVQWRDNPKGISREHRKEQLEYVYATSLAIVRESLAEKGDDNG